MKIWVIGRGYPTPDNKMWGSFELEQAKLLARNGHEVSYIALTLSFWDRKDPRGMRSFIEEGVAIHTFSHFYFPGKAGVYLESFEDKCWGRLFERAEAQSGCPDIIHVHYPSMISSINEIEHYRQRGVKVFATEHWSRVLINDLKKHECARLQYYTSKASCFACVGNSLRESVKRLTEVTVPMEVIPNIISPVFFQQKTRKEGDAFTFISVGRLVPLKQFDAVIDTFLKGFGDNERARLVIVGSGSEMKRLRIAAGGHPRVCFTGEVPLGEVARQISHADALVSFSKYETFAAPVVEAWACGKPVIVSDQSGVAPYVNEYNGLVVPADSTKCLLDAMCSMYNSRDHYHGTWISEFAKAHFSDEAIIISLNRMYVK